MHVVAWGLNVKTEKDLWGKISCKPMRRWREIWKASSKADCKERPWYNDLDGPAHLSLPVSQTSQGWGGKTKLNILSWKSCKQVNPEVGKYTKLEECCAGTAQQIALLKISCQCVLTSHNFWPHKDKGCEQLFYILVQAGWRAFHQSRRQMADCGGSWASYRALWQWILAECITVPTVWQDVWWWHCPSGQPHF